MLFGSCRAGSRTRDSLSESAWCSGCTQSAASASKQTGSRSWRQAFGWLCSDTRLFGLSSPPDQVSQAGRRWWRISRCSVLRKRWRSPDAEDALSAHKFRMLFRASAWRLVSPKSYSKKIILRCSRPEERSGLDFGEAAGLLYLFRGARCERPPARLCLFKWQMSQTSGSTRDPINWWSCNKLRLSNILMALCATCPRR